MRRACPCSQSTMSGATSPWGTENSRRLPSRSVSTRSSSSPGAALRYQTQLIRRRPGVQRPVRAGDQVAEDVRVRGLEEREPPGELGGEVGGLVLRDHAPPGDVPGILRPHLGQELPPDRRAGAVRTHQQVADLLPPALEPGRHPVLARLEPDQPLPVWYCPSGKAAWSFR